MKWLNRNVALNGPNLALCFSEEEFAKALKRLRVKEPVKWMASPFARATTHTFEADGSLCCVVCIGESAVCRDPIEVAGLLVHEAVHVWQQHRDSIGEKYPGVEQEAYAIQCISQTLMSEYARRVTQL